MGGGQSTPAMMSYSVALSKMDHHGQARVKRRFKEMSEGSSPPTVGREAFCNALAPYCSNEALARAIFRACVPGGGKRKNAALDLQDFVAAFGHAVLGSFTQKAGFAFAVFDRHHSGQLSRGDLSHTLELLCSVASESHILLAYPPQTELAPDDDQYAAAVAEMAERAFPPQTQALDFEKFIGWISGNRQLTSFIALVVKVRSPLLVTRTLRHSHARTHTLHVLAVSIAQAAESYSVSLLLAPFVRLSQPSLH